MELSTWITLTAAIFTLILIPGPTGMNQIRLASFNPLHKCIVSALGATTISNLYIAIVFAFMATIQQYTDVVRFLQYFGVAYILYVAWTAIRSSGILSPTTSVAAPRELSFVSMYLSGATVAASNPKDLIFFVSFLPLFVESYNLHEYLVVVATWTFFDVGFSVLYSAAAVFISSRGSNYGRFLNGFAGVALLIIAAIITYRLLFGG